MIGVKSPNPRYSIRENPAMKKRKTKLKGGTFRFTLIFLAGLSLVLYPAFSDRWNRAHQARTVSAYIEEVEGMTDADYAKVLERAQNYNRNISSRTNIYKQSDEEKEEYEACLNIGNDGVMGYIEIPSLKLSIPIYHGTAESTLQKAVGHLEWTSLPVGGTGSHCVLSGHRGLPSAKLFTDLDQLVIGDIFELHVLKETLTYEVDQIRIVEPDETEDLRITEGEDYCTLVTCTPYGINTHRLLVRGHRVETKETKEVRVTSEAVQIEPKLVALILVIPFLLILLGVLTIVDHAERNTDDEI